AAQPRPPQVHGPVRPYRVRESTRHEQPRVPDEQSTGDRSKGDHVGPRSVIPGSACSVQPEAEYRPDASTLLVPSAPPVGGAEAGHTNTMLAVLCMGSSGDRVRTVSTGRRYNPGPCSTANSPARSSELHEPGAAPSRAGSPRSGPRSPSGWTTGRSRS